MRGIGLNPYGLAYSLGIQGAGTARANPHPMTLGRYLELAGELGVLGVEIHAEHLLDLNPDELEQVREAIARRNWWVVLSRPLWIGRWDRTFEAAKRLGASVIRMHCTRLLCGDRTHPDLDWPALFHEVQNQLGEAARAAEGQGLRLAIEDHQDMGSEELLDLCEAAGDNVGVTLDTANPLSVGEDPVEFALAVAERVFHIHFKDYVPHWSDDGYRLVRCPAGDGCVAMERIAEVFAHADVTASIEIGALEARHIRLLNPNWWDLHRPRPAARLAAALSAARVRRADEGADWRTPWEANAGPAAIMEYELSQVARSVANFRAMGLL